MKWSRRRLPNTAAQQQQDRAQQALDKSVLVVQTASQALMSLNQTIVELNNFLAILRAEVAHERPISQETAQEEDDDE